VAPLKAALSDDVGGDERVAMVADETLLRLIANGDKGAMQVLFDRHNVRLFRFLMRLVENEAVAENLVSEVFVEVWRDAAKFEGRPQVAIWLLTIARHKALGVAAAPATRTELG
jgi:RNA polymerase sigma-70 factor (ECF subfamily)